MKDEREISRRRFLQRVGVFGAAGLGAGTLLSACGGEAGQEAGTEAQTAVLSCTDVSGLTPQELQVRQAQAYTDQSPTEDQVCNNCQFWQPPSQEGQCGSCQVIKGPIHPQGYCNLWAERQPTA